MANNETVAFKNLCITLKVEEDSTILEDLKILNETIINSINTYNNNRTQPLIFETAMVLRKDDHLYAFIIFKNQNLSIRRNNLNKIFNFGPLSIVKIKPFKKQEFIDEIKSCLNQGCTIFSTPK